MIKTLIAVILGVAVTVGCAVNLTQTRTGAPLARQVTASGHCGWVAPGLVYVSSSAELQALARTPGQTLALGGLAQLDFSREHLVIVALGQKSTGGYGATLAGSAVQSGDLVLTFTTQRPEKGTMVSQALTTPCTIVAVTAEGWRKLVVSGPDLGPMTRKR